MTILTITRTRTERVRVDAHELGDMLGLGTTAILRYTADGTIVDYVEEFNTDDDGDQMFHGADIGDEIITVSVAS